MQNSMDGADGNRVHVHREGGWGRALASPHSFGAQALSYLLSLSLPARTAARTTKNRPTRNARPTTATPASNRISGKPSPNISAFLQQ